MYMYLNLIRTHVRRPADAILMRVEYTLCTRCCAHIGIDACAQEFVRACTRHSSMSLRTMSAGRRTYVPLKNKLVLTLYYLCAHASHTFMCAARMCAHAYVCIYTCRMGDMHQSNAYPH